MAKRAASINTTKAAELVESKLGLPCTRQSLEYHLKAGNLIECVRSKGPFRIDPTKLLEEFPAKITINRQIRPGTVNRVPGQEIPEQSPESADDHPQSPPPPRPRKPQPPPSVGPEHEMPALVAPAVGSKVRPNLLTSINAAKAWAELEKARKLQIERKASEGEYMRVSDVKPTWEKAFLAISRGLMGVPSKIKSEHPEATFELIESVRRECREVLAKVFDDLLELQPGPVELTEEEQMFDLPDEGDMEFEV